MLAIATNTTMGFFYRDPNVTKHVWQVLFNVRDAALASKGRSDLALAHSGRECGRTARIFPRGGRPDAIFFDQSGAISSSHQRKRG